METDPSIVFCELYYNLINKNIEITLVNNQKINGYINGYYYDDADTENKKISGWHFIESSIDNAFSQLDDEENLSKPIPHKSITTIKYTDNFFKQQIIQFK